MKFKYTNSNNEVALMEAVPLTSELYTELLEVDREFLENVSNGLEFFFNEPQYIEIAKDMLTSFGRGREGSVPEVKPDDSSCILYLSSKTILKPGDKIKQSSETPKKTLRSKLVTSKIRCFKKEKMELIVEVAG
jgi:hypothetical protein